MSLSRDQAKQIIKFVQQDPESRRRIKNYISKVIPNSLGITGGIRNFGLALGYTLSSWRSDENNPFDASHPENANIVCTGISNAAVNAIRGGIKRSSVNTEIESVTTISRILDGTHHTAVQVKMKSNNTYVFDWHANLEVDDPIIYPSVAAFKGGNQKITFSNFNGFR